MAFAFVDAKGNSADANGGTLNASASLNVAAGDSLIWLFKFEGDGQQGGTDVTTTAGKSGSLGTNGATFPAAGRLEHANGDFNYVMGYTLSCTADATFTPSFVLGSNRPFRTLICLQFRPDSGDTVTFETALVGSGTSSGTLSSGNISPSGTDLVAVGGYGHYTSTTPDTMVINGVAGTEPAASPQPAQGSRAWYRAGISGWTNGAASLNNGVSIDWLVGIIVLKAEAAGGGGRTTRNTRSWTHGVNVGMGHRMPLG